MSSGTKPDTITCAKAAAGAITDAFTNSVTFTKVIAGTLAVAIAITTRQYSRRSKN